CRRSVATDRWSYLVSSGLADCPERSNAVLEVRRKLTGLVVAVVVACLATTAVLAQNKPLLIIAERVLVAPKKQTPLAIQLRSDAELPGNTFLRIKKLPKGAELSEGYRVSATTWAVPVDRLSQLRLQLPANLRGEHVIQLQLVSLDGEVHDQRTLKLLAGIKLSAPPKLASRDETDTKRARQQAADVVRAAAGLAVGSQTESKPALGRAPSPQVSPQASVATPSSPQLSPENRDRAQRYMTKGNDYLLEGNVNSARLFYHRAAELGFADAAMALATTYDPNELVNLGISNLPGNADEARKWYQRAVKLGANGAQQRLQRLSSN
ncbi:MAG: hypothetical protein ACR2OV_10265, partial [Hyphomicrobiaceae bacterium]